MTTAGATAQKVSIDGTEGTQVFLPAGTYYLEFTALFAPVRGLYQIGWEERPSGLK